MNVDNRGIPEPEELSTKKRIIMNKKEVLRSNVLGKQTVGGNNAEEESFSMDLEASNEYSPSDTGGNIKVPAPSVFITTPPATPAEFKPPEVVLERPPGSDKKFKVLRRQSTE